MQLYVVRHGIAEEATPDRADTERPLTDQGRRRLRRVIRGLRALDVRIDRIVTSSKLRARQTADALDALCDAEPTSTELLSRSPTPELVALLADAGAAGARRIAVVGHEPWLGELVALLAFGETRFAAALELKKASVTWLDGDAAPGAMTIRAILPPKVLRSVG
jgi:phosphohistidine phosphatase